MTDMQTVVPIGKDALAISATHEIFNHVDTAGEMWSGSGDRTLRVPVRFTTVFASPPVVQVGLAGIDTAREQNLRFYLFADDVHAEGFTLRFVTWSDSRIGRASVNWAAFGQPARPTARAATASLASSGQTGAGQTGAGLPPSG